MQARTCAAAEVAGMDMRLLSQRLTLSGSN